MATRENAGRDEALDTPSGEPRDEYVRFDTAVVFNGSALLGVEMTCQVCGEIGYKAADALIEHAWQHAQDEAAR